MRAQILKIHASRRGVVLDESQLTRLADASEGFSRAELEQAIVAAVYSAHGGNAVTNADHTPTGDRGNAATVRCNGGTNCSAEGMGVGTDGAGGLNYEREWPAARA